MENKNTFCTVPSNVSDRGNIVCKHFPFHKPPPTFTNTQCSVAFWIKSSNRLWDVLVLCRRSTWPKRRHRFWGNSVGEHLRFLHLCCADLQVENLASEVEGKWEKVVKTKRQASEGSEKARRRFRHSNSTWTFFQFQCLWAPLNVIHSLAAYSLTHRHYGNIYSTWRPDSLLENKNDWVSDSAYYDCTFVRVHVDERLCMYLYIQVSVCISACAMPQLHRSFTEVFCATANGRCFTQQPMRLCSVGRRVYWWCMMRRTDSL